MVQCGIMWKVVVFSLVLWNTTKSQPPSQSHGSPHPPNMECCPCPGSNINQDAVDAASSASTLREVSSPVLDDCPCRLRSADSEGASSIFFPRAVHPLRALLKPADPQEEKKPLLHPEVDLASSVLQTLREATDEEYQEALARDAARSAARDDPALGDTTSDAAKNIIIVLNHERDNDALPEAANTQVQFAHPLSRSNLDKPLRGVFNISPKVLQKKIADMEEGASNIQENTSVIKSREGVTLKPDPSIFKLFSSKTKTDDDGKFKNLFKLRGSNIKLPTNKVDLKKLDLSSTFKKIPSLRLNHPSIRTSETKSFKPLSLTAPKWKLGSLKRENIDMDDDVSPSNINEKFIDITKGRHVPRLGFSSLLQKTDPTTRKSPFAFKNILKLKDVELIPSRKTTVKIDLPALQPVINLKNKAASIPEEDYKDCDLEKPSNIQLIPRGRKGKTEILDVLPSASENSHVVAHIDPPQQHNESFENLHDEEFSANGEPENEEPNPTEEMQPMFTENTEQNTLEQLGKVSERVQDLETYDDSLELIINKNQDSGDDLIVVDIADEPLNSETDFKEINISENETSDIAAQNFEVTGIFERPVFDGVLNEDEKTIADGHQISPVDILVGKGIEEEDISLEDSSAELTNHRDVQIIPEEQRQLTEENLSLETPNQESTKGRQDEHVSLEASGAKSTNHRNVLIIPDEQRQLTEDSFETPNQESTETEKRQTIEGNYNSETVTSKLTQSNVNLPKVKESIVLKLHNLHKPNNKILSISRFTNLDEKEDKGSLSSGFITEQNMKGTEITSENLTRDNRDEISTQQLQEISDSLLNQSIIQTESRDPNLNEENLNMLQEDSNAFLESSGETTQILDSDTSPSNHHTEIVETIPDANVNEGQNFEETNETGNMVAEDNQNNSDTLKGTSCPSGLEKFGNSKYEERDVQELPINAKLSEMDVGASEQRASFVPSLRQQVVQPSSLLDDSILTPPALPDLRDLLSGGALPTLPSLSDLTSGLFGGNEKRADDENVELSSSEFDPNTDCADDNPVMSTDASTRNSKLSLPGLQDPFEDLNLNIFQLSPLAQKGLGGQKIPSLNLNSFKLAVPKNLQLRPMKLQSSLGKDGNLLGASLSLGKTPLLSSTPLGNLPDLEELRDQMRANADSLLRSPLKIHLNPLETLKTTSENLRSHTENTVKNLQHSLASTLNEATLNNRGEKLATPRVDLFEMVTNAHEDMKDKLLGIHTDLQDRLETLHDHIKETTSLPALRMPQLSDMFKIESPFRQTSISKLRTAQPKKMVKSQRKPGFRINKPSQISSASSRNNLVKLRPFKMSKAASSLTPKSVAVPKLMVTSEKPPFVMPLERSSGVKLRENKPTGIQTSSRNIPNQPLTRKTISRTQQPSISPSIRKTNNAAVSSSRQTSSKGSRKPITRLTIPKSRFDVDDTAGHASEVRPTIVDRNGQPNDVRSFSEETTLKSSPIFKTKPWSMESSSEKAVTLVKPTLTPSEKLPSLKKPTLSLPKPTESPLLARLRESLRAKANLVPLRSVHGIGNDLKAPPKDKSSSSTIKSLQNDMDRSPSESNAIIVSQEPMKENVSYKCKMVCYREPSK